jgi:hypothetical protein
MFREDEEKLRAQLGDKYDTFKQELSEISNRAMPMDFGPNSSNQKYSDQMVKDRDSLYQRYGVQPTAPSPEELTLPNSSYQKFNKSLNNLINEEGWDD